MTNISHYHHFDMLHEEEFSCNCGSSMQKAILAFTDRLNTVFFLQEVGKHITLSEITLKSLKSTSMKT